MTSARRIDFHFHLIPKFYRDAVYEAGTGPQIGRYPDWSPERALELMDAHSIEVALTSLAGRFSVPVAWQERMVFKARR